VDFEGEKNPPAINNGLSPPLKHLKCHSTTDRGKYLKSGAVTPVFYVKM